MTIQRCATRWISRANVMTKMQANGLSELVRFAIRAGIVED